SLPTPCNCDVHLPGRIRASILNSLESAASRTGLETNSGYRDRQRQTSDKHIRSLERRPPPAKIREQNGAVSELRRGSRRPCPCLQLMPRAPQTVLPACHLR